MNQGEVLEIGRQAMDVALRISLPVLGLSLLAGLIVAIFQAVTQVQEMTLTYVPKILAVVLALVLFGGWMLTQIVSFASQSFHAIERVGR
jgi:flagellar biosynthetic protein FliQ